jgi:hypothetical protein
LYVSYTLTLNGYTASSNSKSKKRIIQDVHQSHILTEGCGREVTAPASYLGGSGFKSQPRDRQSWLRFSRFFSVTPGECRDSTLKLGHDHFLPNPFQFIVIHMSPKHWRYIV